MITPQLNELIHATKKFNSDSQSSDILSGEVDLGLFWNGEAVLAQRENPAIQYIYPTEGAILCRITTHSGMARSIVMPRTLGSNYTMQADMFWMMLRDFPYTNPNQAALEFAKANHPDLYQEYVNSTITNVPAQVMMSGQWLNDLGDNQSLYDKVWEEANS